jgi:hypothetical protein
VSIILYKILRFPVIIPENKYLWLKFAHWPCFYASTNVINYLNTKRMEQICSWEADSCWANQIPRLLLKSVYYRVHKSTALYVILCNLNSLQTLTHYSLRIHFNISLHLLLGLPSSFFTPGFLTTIWYRSTVLVHIMYGARKCLKTALQRVVRFYRRRAMFPDGQLRNRNGRAYIRRSPWWKFIL